MAGGTFPTSIPSYTVTAGAETANGAAGGTGLSPLLNNFETDITALANKVGSGATVPAVNTILFGTGANTSAWQGLTSAQLAAILSDETGSGLAVFGTSPTIVTPTIASFTNAQHNHSNAAGGGNISGANAITAGTVDSAALATGVPVQMATAMFSAVATGTTLLPSDDTIPQNTEGDQYMTLAFTPKSATNMLFIEAKSLLANSSAASVMTSALFQDTTANALAANNVVYAGANYQVNTLVGHSMVAGTTSSTTFKIRSGSSTAGTTTFNGVIGARLYGGINLSYIRITEYKV